MKNDHLPRFKAGNIKQGMESVVGNCNGHSCEERMEIETPAFARVILHQLPERARVVLDYGCGIGRLAKEILKQNNRITILGVDASSDELRLAEEYVDDSRFIPTKPEDLAQKVDMIYCVYVLQHVPAIELRHAIERMHHFLKPGGKLVYCSSDYRMAINQGGGFTDDRHLGVDIRKEIARLFDEEKDLFDFSMRGAADAREAQLVKDLVTAEGCPPGSIPHPAKVYVRREFPALESGMPYFMCEAAEMAEKDASTHQESPENSKPTKASKKAIPAASGPRRLILQNRLAPGDILVMTAAIRSLHKAHPGKFITDVESPVPEIFQNNPHVTALNGDGQKIDMHYPLISDHTMRGFAHPGAGVSGRHFSDGHRKFLEEVLEIEIPRSGLTPEIHLSQDERLWKSPILKHHDHDGPYWVINAGSKSDFTLKQYHRYQEVVDLMAGKVTFVQIGQLEHNHAPLKGALDMRGKTSHRELFRTIYHAEGVLTPVSYPMHIAAAFGKPCVVIAGGRESTRWELYPNHRFLHTNGALPCCAYDGCWKSKLEDCADPVEHAGVEVPKCMNLITPADVARAIDLYYEGGILTREESHV